MKVVCILFIFFVLFSAYNIVYHFSPIYLPNHYEIWEIENENFTLLRRQANLSDASYVRVIGPNIIEYAIVGEVVVGEIGDFPERLKKLLEGQPIDTQGFFVVHTRRMLVWKGLNKEKVLEILKSECGINEMPALKILYKR
ncbi:MAG TPA: hypothetical protein PLI09_27305 [Candidatus Hydrogenedentes bacterium]|nr:hypothetical protein [Candidatus Hydrogenedentota bacterium]